jgi:eukaryotic-like serine/threonine-protein kinase
VIAVTKPAKEDGMAVPAQPLPPRLPSQEPRVEPADDALASTAAEEVVPIDASGRLQRGSVVGRYVIIDLVGGGGMGTVYSAYDPDLDRRIAIKLVRSDESGGGHARLLREAQALARLQHPNVVAVHDVGLLENRVFVAMELVEGPTLARWLALEPRSWREVVAKFIQAGEGLLAAHESGIIHRDFKPQNVLIDREGRVRVADFGLARAAVEANVPEISASSSDRLSLSLTHTGAFLGTPLYASPEQLGGQPADARSDQFSFCVALYEALFDERPFAAGEIDRLTLLTTITIGEIKASKAGVTIPRWLRDLVIEGLHAEPEQRHASMKVVLDGLRRQRLTARRAGVVAGGLAAAAFVGVVANLGTSTSAPGSCELPERRLDGIWDDQRRAAIRGAFHQSGVSYSGEVLARVERTLDQYAGEWTNAYAESCPGTERQEPEAYLRVGCLSQSLEELRSQTELLARADTQTIENAVKMVQSLPPVERCARGTIASLPPPPPAHARFEVERIRRALADAKALERSGHYAEGLALANPLPEAAKKLAYRPVEAEALLQRATLADAAGDHQVASTDVRAATLAAVASRHDQLLAEAWVLATWVADERGAYTEATDASQHALAAIERVGGDDALHARLLNRLGNVYWHQGKQADAISTQQSALALAASSLPPQAIERSWILNDLGVLLSASGRPDHALPYLMQALQLKEAALGAAHPDVGRTLNNVGYVEMLMGKLPDATAHTKSGLAIVEQALGAGHPEVANVRVSLATVLLLQGELDAAKTHAERAIEDTERALGRTHPSLAEPLTVLGRALIEQHQAARAIAPLERALALPRGHFGIDDDRAETRLALARALWDGGGDRIRARKLGQEAATAKVAGAQAWLDAHVGAQ